MLEFQCPHCNEVLSIPEQFLGSEGTCRKCKGKITITQQTPHDKDKEFNAYSVNRNPTLIAMHVETSGPSSRKFNLIEVSGIKIDQDGKELDSFWSFCNPDQAIPEKIQERTGITDDMVLQAPLPYEVLNDFFNWAGSQVVFLCDHAHYHAKFLSAALYQEDFEPPKAYILDVMKWAKAMAVPTSQYKLRVMLESLGHPLRSTHRRAMDTSQGVREMVKFLVVEQQKADGHYTDSGMLSKLMRKKEEAEKTKVVYDAILALANPLDEMCGEKFHARESYFARKNPMKTERTENGNKNKNSHKVPLTPVPFLMHMPEWYEEKKRVVETSINHPDMFKDEENRSHGAGTTWEFSMLEASQSRNPKEKHRHLVDAISQGAMDPWPYEQLTGLYIQVKDYRSAHKVCERYFDTDSWQLPKNVKMSLKLLDRLERLEQQIIKPVS